MKQSEAIIATLVYHDIFNYPLKLEEIHRYLIGKKSNIAPVAKELQRLLKLRKIGTAGGYYFLKKRRNLVNIRKRRERYSKTKLKKAIFFAKILKVVPTLKLMGISGALSMENSHKDDDIDLVIISSRGNLWTTRFAANLLLLPFKRDPYGEKVSNRACLNLFLDESNLEIKDRNLYFAHEICQMKPLWDRDGTYRRFIRANSWIKKYLPNWQLSTEILDHRPQKSIKVSLRARDYPLRTVENFLRNFQLAYMRPKITTEKITKTQLFFHPQNTGKLVMEEYQRRLVKSKFTKLNH